MKTLPRYSVLLVSASVLFSSAVFAQSSRQTPKATNAKPPAANANATAANNAASDAADAAKAKATAPAPGMVLPTPDKSNPAAASITGDLDVSAAADAIGMQTFTNKDKATNELDQRLTGSQSRLQALKVDPSMSDEAKNSFTKGMSDAQLRGAELKKSIDAARSATEAKWEENRSLLVASYASYAEAVARVEIALSHAVTTKKPSSP